MKCFIFIFIVASLATSLFFSSCTPVVVYSGKNQDYENVYLKKAVINIKIFNNENDALLEDILVEKLKEHKIEAIPAHTIWQEGEFIDYNKKIATLNKHNADGLLSMQPSYLSKENHRELDYIFFNRIRTNVFTPLTPQPDFGYTVRKSKQDVITFLAELYDINTQAVIWACYSESRLNDFSDMNKLLKEMAKTITEKLLQDDVFEKSL